MKMDYKTVLLNSVEKGDALINSSRSILECEAYCAQLYIYRRYMKQNVEKAELYYNSFREFNDRIFKQSIDILELAIQEANTELAECAMETIQIIKTTYPEFYNSYFNQVFGK